MKNYLLNALMASGIVIGLSLSGAALGVALKNNKKTESPSISLADLDGGVLSVVGDFKKKLTPGSALEKMFFEYFGFDKNDGTWVINKRIKTMLVGTKILDGGKITPEFIGKFRNSPNSLKVTEKILVLCKVGFYIELQINLDWSEKVKFNKEWTNEITVLLNPTSSGNKFTIFNVMNQPNNFVEQAGGSVENLLKPLITVDNKDDFEVYYVKSGGVAQSDGSDFQYALALNKKTGAVWFFTTTATEKITIQIKFIAIETGKKLWKT